MKVQFAGTPEQLEKIIELRYRILREPWGQDKETATDNQEDICYNAFITDDTEKVIACGRLQINEGQVGQIRYMAVSPESQGKGLGKLILEALEKKGKELGLSKIELQARENAKNFYLANNYKLVKGTFKLWDIIQHYLMKKNLS